MSTLDKVREIIRAEVAKANPAENSHQSIERFILSEIDCTEADGNLTITVLDEDRQPLPGRTIQDLIADLRSRRPALFKAAPITSEPTTSNVEPHEHRAAEETPVDVVSPATSISVATEAAASTAHIPTPLPQERDWLLLESGTGPGSGQAGSRLVAGEVLNEIRSYPPPESERDVAKAAVPQAPRAEIAAPRAPPHVLPADGTAPRLRQRHVLAASAGILLVALGGSLLYTLLPSWDASEPPAGAAPSSQPTTPPAPPDRAGSAPPASHPARTGSIGAALPAREPEPSLAGDLQGPAEVIDTATLSIRGKVAPLFGVQSRPGEGQPAQLSGYLRRREVRCLPANANVKAYRCEVEGQDLSKVVLFNGGGRATPDASPDLLAAEAHARSAKRGLWANSSR